MRCVSLTLLASSLLGCAGPYEVGEMSAGTPPVGGTVGSATAGAAGASSSGGSASGAGGGGGAGGTGNPLTECDVPLGEPEALAGPFAEPQAVWGRLSLWLKGAATAAPAAMPTTTTPTWSGQLAVDALRQSQSSDQGALGVRHFLTTAFDLEPSSEVASVWSQRLLSGTSPLQLLYASPWGEHRTGIFGEVEWLRRHPRTVSRGVTLLRGVFNEFVPPPPPGVLVLPPPGGALTSRQAIEQHTQNASCFACHSKIDPLGLALEHFDENGAYRDLDAGQPVDSSGSYTGSYGEQFTFQSMEDLGVELAQSCQARIAFADLNLKQALLDAGLMLEGEDITLSHREDLARVRQAFIHQQDYPSLVRAIAQTQAFLR